MSNRRLVILFALLVSACSAGEPGTPPLQLDYSQLGKIALDVQTLEVVDRSNGPAANSVPFRPTIEDAMRRWAADRLQAAGTSGQATVIIAQADMAAQPLPVKTGMGGWFERQQASAYTGHVKVDVEAKGREGYAVASAEATRTVSLPEDPGDAERQEAYNAMLAGLMEDLNRNLDQAIHEHLQDFVITAPVLDSEPPQPPMPVPESPGQSP